MKAGRSSQVTLRYNGVRLSDERLFILPILPINLISHGMVITPAPLC
jgi:hypothetical protein